MVGKITQGGTNTRARPTGAQPDSAKRRTLLHARPGGDAGKDRHLNQPLGRRASFSRFLPVLALLVGAVSLFATPPAQAQQLTIGFCSSEERTIKEGEQVVLAVDITPDLTPDLVRARGIVLPVEIPLTLTPGTSDPGDVRLPGTVVILPPLRNIPPMTFRISTVGSIISPIRTM